MPHIHEFYDFTTAVFIVNGGSVLLVNHPRYDKWLPPGGHIELDEDPEQALYREIEEETGLNVELMTTKPSFASPGTKFMPTPNFMDVHEANPPHRHIGLTYFALSNTRDARLSDEHKELAWVAEANLEDSKYSLSEAIKFYCREAIKLESVRVTTKKS